MWKLVRANAGCDQKPCGCLPKAIYKLQISMRNSSKCNLLKSMIPRQQYVDEIAYSPYIGPTRFVNPNANLIVIKYSPIEFFNP
jgi:hypothetical protein